MMPYRGAPPGAYHSQIDMATSVRKMKVKKAAVGHVHAIHDRGAALSIFPSSDAPEGEALGDVIAHEIDDEGAGHDGEHPRCRQKSELIARRAGRPRHRRSDRFRLDR